MLDKYQQFHKINKSQHCSLYAAISRQTGQQIIIKRIKNKLLWDEVLTNKNFLFSQKSKMFAKMIEIFKSKGEFYIAYQRPTSYSLEETDLIGKMRLEDFYVLFYQICQFVQDLRIQQPNAYILPEWIYLHRNTARVIHFEPFFSMNKTSKKSEHVYQFQLENLTDNPEGQDSSSSIIPINKQRNIFFNLSLIAYYLLTGEKKKSAQNQEQYLDNIQQIMKKAQSQFLKFTKDKKITDMLVKMMSENVFDVPKLQNILKAFENKANLSSPKKKMYTNNIEIQIEKIKLQHKDPPEILQHKKLRHCCLEMEQSLQKIKPIPLKKLLQQDKEQNKNKFKSVRATNQKPYISNTKKSISFFPTIGKSKGNHHFRQKTVIDVMSTTMSRPLMFQNRSFFLQKNV